MHSAPTRPHPPRSGFRSPQDRTPRADLHLVRKDLEGLLDPCAVYEPVYENGELVDLVRTVLNQAGRRMLTSLGGVDPAETSMRRNVPNLVASDLFRRYAEVLRTGTAWSGRDVTHDGDRLAGVYDIQAWPVTDGLRGRPVVRRAARRPGDVRAGAVGRVRGGRDAGGTVLQGPRPAPADAAQLDERRRHLAHAGRHRVDGPGAGGGRRRGVHLARRGHLRDGRRGRRPRMGASRPGVAPLSR